MTTLVIASVLSGILLEGTRLQETDSFMEDLLVNNKTYQLAKKAANPRIFFTESYLENVKLAEAQKILKEQYPEIASIVQSEQFKTLDFAAKMSHLHEHLLSKQISKVYPPLTE